MALYGLYGCAMICPLSSGSIDVVVMNYNDTRIHTLHPLSKYDMGVRECSCVDRADGVQDLEEITARDTRPSVEAESLRNAGRDVSSLFRQKKPEPGR